MKTKHHLLSEFVDRITVPNRRAAMTAYLESEVHRVFILAGVFKEQCKVSTANLLKGEIAPQLDICCCGDTFKIILTTDPRIRYDGCSLPDDEEDEGAAPPKTNDRILSDPEYARLSKLSRKRLLEVLYQDFDCCKSSYGQRHESDKDAQWDYYEAVLKRFLSAARYAKAIGSDSDALWMEAFRLLQPKITFYNNQGVNIISALGLIPENVEEAYAVAQKAQARLWVDNAVRTLKPAKIAKSGKKRQ